MGLANLAKMARAVGHLRAYAVREFPKLGRSRLPKGARAGQEELARLAIFGGAVIGCASPSRHGGVASGPLLQIEFTNGHLRRVSCFRRPVGQPRAAAWTVPPSWLGRQDDPQHFRF